MVIDSLKIERVPWIPDELMSTRGRLPWQLDFIDPTACLEFLSGQGWTTGSHREPETLPTGLFRCIEFSLGRNSGGELQGYNIQKLTYCTNRTRNVKSVLIHFVNYIIFSCVQYLFFFFSSISNIFPFVFTTVIYFTIIIFLYHICLILLCNIFVKNSNVCHNCIYFFVYFVPFICTSRAFHVIIKKFN